MIRALRAHADGDAPDRVNSFFAKHATSDTDKDKILEHVKTLASAGNGRIWVKFITEYEMSLYPDESEGNLQDNESTTTPASDVAATGQVARAIESSSSTESESGVEKAGDIVYGTLIDQFCGSIVANETGGRGSSAISTTGAEELLSLIDIAETGATEAEGRGGSDVDSDDTDHMTEMNARLDRNSSDEGKKNGFGAFFK
jgi:hypothetical protein